MIFPNPFMAWTAPSLYSTIVLNSIEKNKSSKKRTKRIRSNTRFARIFENCENNGEREYG